MGPRRVSLQFLSRRLIDCFASLRGSPRTGELSGRSSLSSCGLCHVELSPEPCVISHMGGRVECTPLASAYSTQIQGPQEVAGLLWTFTKYCLHLMLLQILRRPFLSQQTCLRAWEPLTSIRDHRWTSPECSCMEYALDIVAHPLRGLTVLHNGQ